MTQHDRRVSVARRRGAHHDHISAMTTSEAVLGRGVLGAGSLSALSRWPTTGRIFSAARARLARRIRIPASAIWRLEGRTDLPGGLATGAGLALPLAMATWVGHSRVGVILTLPIVLIAIPFDVPPPTLERIRVLGVRVVAIALSGVYVGLVGGRAWVLVPAVAAAAALGALTPTIGPTPAWALVLIGAPANAVAFGVPGLPQLVGGLWGLAVTAPEWSRILRRNGKAPSGTPRSARPDPIRAATQGAAVGVASAVMAAAGHLAGDGHWLVTSVLLTSRRTHQATRARARDRAVGNIAGCLLAALLLSLHPTVWALVAILAASAIVAYGLRPANYLYWALAFPVLVLTLADIGQPVTADTAAVRAGLVVAGGLFALAVSWLLHRVHPSSDDWR